MMRKYACHRIYTDPDHYLSQAFVAIDEEGKVIRYASFQEEMVATEWIGGVIYLTDTNTAPNGDFHLWFNNHIKNGQTPVYAWHLSEFNFVREEPTPNCIFSLL